MVIRELDASVGSESGDIKKNPVTKNFSQDGGLCYFSGTALTFLLTFVEKLWELCYFVPAYPKSMNPL